MVDFQSLYRRYRPQRFAEVRGQDHVVSALRHAVRDDHVAHAYLFSGPRGTGKTSTARILAKALNCTNPVEGEPCGVCDSCVDITRGASFDVHELDAASTNHVDAMRDLVARASLATPGRWKVYIVDEVHMLSQAASNALLKTLEEPPDHVVFVLATTDPQKMLPTIRSRTQHYEFHLLDAEVLAMLLADVAADAKLELPDAAVETAVRRGRGSARDALSALDQVVASGVVDDDSQLVHELLLSLSERDTARALIAVENALVAGRDAPRIAAELLDELRTQFLTAMAPGVAREGDPPTPSSPAGEVPGTGPASRGTLLLGPARSVRAMEVLGTAMVAMRDALDARITLEVAIVRLTHPEADDDPAALLERIERLERRIQELSSPTAGAAPPPPPPHPAASGPGSPAASATRPRAEALANLGSPDSTAVTPTAVTPTAVTPTAVTESRPALGAFSALAAPTNDAQLSASRAGHVAERPTTEAVAVPPPASDQPPPASDQPPPTRDDLVAAWGDHVLNQLRPRVRAVFAVGRFLPSEDSTAILALPNTAHVERAEEHAPEVADALGRHFGRPIRLRLVTEADAGSVHPSPPSGGGANRGSPPAQPPDRGGPAQSRPAGALIRNQAPEHGIGGAEEVLDPDELDPLGEQVPGDAASWAQERLMQVFPGAEEV